jgi:APA family basic amino acid/polyamine antiporter
MDNNEKKLGFWSCWSLNVGIMIGSGVFLLPAILAPFGLMSFAGWLITGGGSILLALVFSRLSSRTSRSGGPYIYTKDAFGNLPAFLIAWSYWCCYWIAIPATAIAFVGYLTIFIPALEQDTTLQCIATLALMWTLTLVNIRGLKEASSVQIITTILKLIPLVIIIGLGFAIGSSDNLPEFNPQNMSVLEGLAATALLTMWAFSGMEAGTMPAGDVKNAQTTIPRAIVAGTLTVAVVYIASTAAIMMLVPAQVLVNSTAPFADAAQALGDWGPKLVAIGAMVSTAGALNGVIFISGQMPTAVALDKLTPAILARKNKGGAPVVSLLLASSLATVLLIANYSRGLIGSFTFLVMMSTLTYMVPLLASALAEFKYSLKSSRAWAAVAMIAFLYSVFIVLGSGLEVIAWCIVFVLIGVPVYYLGRTTKT